MRNEHMYHDAAGAAQYDKEKRVDPNGGRTPAKRKRCTITLLAGA